MSDLVPPVSIPFVDRLTRDEFESHYLAADRPVMIRGGVTATPAFRKWNFEFLRQRVGHRTIQLSTAKTGVFNPNVTDPLGKLQESDVSLADALAIIRNSSDASSLSYVMQQSIPEKLPELLDDVPPPEWIPASGRVAKVNLWLGPSGCISPLHYDSKQNFLAQICGRKQFTMFAPSETDKLYPDRNASLKDVSQVDLFAPDLEKFPRFAEAHPIEVICSPGDCLFIPSHWWHCVRSLDDSISVNFWWETAEMRLRRAEALLRHRFAG